jgi:Holliday junction resolvase RusA-like endonuclease
MIWEVAPFPKPRMTQRDKWKKRPVVVKYILFKEALKYFAEENCYKVPEVLSITFVIGMPKSWSKKKKAQMLGKPHQQRPDLDNLIKAFKDALCEDDSHVHTYGAMKKVWGETPHIVVHDNFILENNEK